jgi:hypothetical protein
MGTPSTKLSTEGQALVADFRKVVEQAKYLLLTKNEGNLLQDFIWQSQQMEGGNAALPGAPVDKHAPGVMVGKDAAPEFHAQTLPAGRTPSSSTFQPNPDTNTLRQPGNPATSDTITGATSAEVHTGYGHPGQGQTSQELHGGGKKERSGLTGVGADQGDAFREQGLDRDHLKGGKAENAKDGEEVGVGAQERTPVGAEEVADELK